MNQRRIIELVAPAKLNLNLNIGERRSDGYHEIDSVVQTISLHDTVFVSVDWGGDGAFAKKEGVVTRFLGRAGEPFDQFSGRLLVDYSETVEPGAETGEPSKNLLIRALDLALGFVGLEPLMKLIPKELSRADGDALRLSIHLNKVIPSGAGLGGGSSDAAAVLRLIKELVDINYPFDALQTGLMIGADVPFLIEGGTSRMTGIGEVLEPLKGKVPTWHYLLVKPAYGISTVEAYASVDRADYTNRSFNQVEFIEGIYNSDEKMLQMYGGNDFLPVIAESAGLTEWKNRLLRTRTLFADLSGSGSTVFAAYKDKVEAENAQKAIMRYAESTYVRTILTHGLPSAYNLSIM